MCVCVCVCVCVDCTDPQGATGATSNMKPCGVTRRDRERECEVMGEGLEDERRERERVAKSMWTANVTPLRDLNLEPRALRRHYEVNLQLGAPLSATRLS